MTATAPSDAFHPWTPVALVALSTLLGAALGAATNVSNAVISPYYFRAVMGWWAAQDVSLRAVMQGTLEGSIIGFAFGTFLSVFVAATTKLRCPPRTVLSVLPVAFVIAFICWVIGGVAGAGLAAVLPQSLRPILPLAPADRVALVRFTWVGGSIWGAYFGGVVAVVYAAMEVKRRWRRINDAAAAFDVIKPVVSTDSGG